jgi:hypothetical protein
MKLSAPSQAFVSSSIEESQISLTITQDLQRRSEICFRELPRLDQLALHLAKIRVALPRHVESRFSGGDFALHLFNPILWLLLVGYLLRSAEAGHTGGSDRDRRVGFDVAISGTDNQTRFLFMDSLVAGFGGGGVSIGRRRLRGSVLGGFEGRWR